MARQVYTLNLRGAGVTDAHLIVPGLVGSVGARNLHKLAQELVDAYASPPRLTKILG